MGKEKGRAPKDATFFDLLLSQVLALTGLEPALRLVDHIDAALTAHDAAIAMALLERAEGVTDLHGACPSCRGARIAPWVKIRGKPREFMVDDTGIEPVTPSMSTKCSTAELIIHAVSGLMRPIKK